LVRLPEFRLGIRDALIDGRVIPLASPSFDDGRRMRPRCIDPIAPHG